MKTVVAAPATAPPAQADAFFSSGNGILGLGGQNTSYVNSGNTAWNSFNKRW